MERGGQQEADRCRERSENLGQRGRNEWSFVFHPEVYARGTAVVCVRVCVLGEGANTKISPYYVPGTLLAPWNHPARR